MDPITLQDPESASTARIAPGLGFNCFEFRAEVGGERLEVIACDPAFAEAQSRADPPLSLAGGNGIPILFPFPNRIRNGRYTWEGQEYQLSSSNVPFLGENAIHGFCLDRPWRLVDRGDHFAVGRFQLSLDAPDRLDSWPADGLIEVRYELRAGCLRADVRIANPGEVPFPWGFGTHPYFRLPLAARSDPKHCLIEAPAAEQWELADLLPTGNRIPVPPEKDLRDGAYFDILQLDDFYTGVDARRGVIEHLLMDEAAGLQVVQRCDAALRELVVFTPPDRKSVCLEPYTCATDAVNLHQRGIDAGWRILEPGEEFRTWIEVRPGVVVV